MTTKPTVELDEVRMGVETDPDAKLRMEIAALGWRLQNSAYDMDKSVAFQMDDAETTLRRLRREADQQPAVAVRDQEQGQ